MKRYVKELARDIMKEDHPMVKKGLLQHPGAKEIRLVLKSCERGRITDKEAVWAIMAIHDKHDCESWTL